MRKKWIGSMLLGICVALGCAAPAMADSRKVVTLGADLSQEQKDMMMRYFGMTYDAVDVIYINNTDERNHLGAYVPLEQIGNYTYSCALVAPTSSGGIQVKTANLDWVTSNMIATTLSTSGVTNCQVVAACPFRVSGTGALTGVIMAYENASQQILDPAKVELANQELVATGNLANEVGQSKATAVINETKEQVIENNITNIDEITNVLNNVSNNYNVTINADQSAQIAELLQQIAQQEYDITQLKATLDRVQANVAGDAGASEEDVQAAQQQAELSEQAALEAAQQQQQQMENETVVDEGIIIGDDFTTEEEDENILQNTDPSVLEQGGTPVLEEDTTKTVQEQSEAQTEAVLPQEETQAQTEAIAQDETQAPETDAQQTETAAFESDAQPGEPETAATEAQSETELTADMLDTEAKELFDQVKEDVETTFATTTISSEDGGTQVYLTEDAAKQMPEKITKYLLQVLVKGADAVAAEEDADETISKTIVEETSSLAPDKDYEDPDLQQMDKYVRRLIFRDSENFLEQSMLEDADKTFLYDSIMKILEEAYQTEDEAEGEELPEEPLTEAEPEQILDGTADPAADGAQADPAIVDEFAGFEEEVYPE